jgi:hypothetical protein
LFVSCLCRALPAKDEGSAFLIMAPGLLVLCDRTVALWLFICAAVMRSA